MKPEKERIAEGFRHYLSFVQAWFTGLRGYYAGYYVTHLPVVFFKADDDLQQNLVMRIYLVQ